jgi:hypothetical protein
MVFFKPISIEVNSTPIIVYSCPGIETVLSNKDVNSIKNYIQDLFNINNLKNNGKYNVVILWNDKKEIMVDLWVYDKIESWGSGPLVDVKIFKNKKQITNMGVSAGNGLVLLGIEEQHRWTKKSLTEYLTDKRPNLPEQIDFKKSFYEK